MPGNTQHPRGSRQLYIWRHCMIVVIITILAIFCIIWLAQTFDPPALQFASKPMILVHETGTGSSSGNPLRDIFQISEYATNNPNCPTEPTTLTAADAGLTTFDDPETKMTMLISSFRNPLVLRLQCDAKQVPQIREPFCPVAWCWGEFIEDNPCAFGCTDYCQDPSVFLYRRQFIGFHT